MSVNAIPLDVICVILLSTPHPWFVDTAENYLYHNAFLNVSGFVYAVKSHLNKTLGAVMIKMFRCYHLGGIYIGTGRGPLDRTESLGLAVDCRTILADMLGGSKV